MTRREWGLPTWWARFWFAPGSAHALAAARVVFAAQALWILLSRDFAGVAGAPAEFWWAVPLTRRWRYLAFPGHAGWEAAVQVVAAACLIGVLLGWRPRWTALIAGILLYHLAPFESLFWTDTPYFRGLDTAIVGLVTLSFTPCADVWAVGRATSGHGPPETAAWEYRWGLVLLQVFVAVPYLFAAYAKLYQEGWAWASAGNIRDHLLVFTQDDFGAVFTAAGSWLARRPLLCAAVGVGTLVFELTFIAAVFSRRARWVYVPAALAFHAGITVTMNVVWLYWPLLGVFVNWDYVRQRGRALRGGPAPASSAVNRT